MSNRINNLRFVSAALIAAGALALGIPAINAQSTNESPSTAGKIESGGGHAASGIGSAASSAASDMSRVFRMSCIHRPHPFGNEDQGSVAHFLSAPSKHNR